MPKNTAYNSSLFCLTITSKYAIILLSDVIDVVYRGTNRKGKLFKQAGGKRRDDLVKTKCGCQGSYR